MKPVIVGAHINGAVSRLVVHVEQEGVASLESDHELVPTELEAGHYELVIVTARVPEPHLQRHSQHRHISHTLPHLVASGLVFSINTVGVEVIIHCVEVLRALHFIHQLH